MGKKEWFLDAIIGFFVGIISICTIQYFVLKPKFDLKTTALNNEISELNREIVSQRKSITAYQRALIGEESDMLSIYDSVQSTSRVDIIVHSDTESGLPVKFQIKCE